MKNTLTLNFSLFDGRHEIPEAVDGSLFGACITPMMFKLLNSRTDLFFSRLRSQALYRIWDVCENKGFTHVDPDWNGCDETPMLINDGLYINLYVTGYTPALIEVIKLCQHEGFNLTLYHYNNETGQYFPQYMY